MKLFIRIQILASIFFLSINLVAAQNRTLDFYLQMGISNSPLLKDINNQTKANGYDSLLVRAGFQPQIGATGQALYAPVFNNFGYDSAITNGGNYSGMINVNQSLFNKKIRNAQLQNLALLNQSLATNSKFTETDLKKSITSQYITAYSDYSQVQFYKLVVQKLRQQKESLKPLVEHGIYLQTDYLNLNVNITAQQIAITQTMMQFKTDLNVLNYLCGIVDTATVILANPKLSVKNNFDAYQTPLMLQFKIDSLKNSNDASLNDLNYRPRLDAFGNAGFNAINPKNIPDNFGASIGLNFAIPIYDGKQRKTQHSKIMLQENTRLNYQDFYLNQYQQKINQFHIELSSTEELIVQIQTQLSEQQDLIDLYKIEIEKGLVRFTDVITALNNYINTQNTLTIIENNRMQIINEMNYIK